MCPLWPWDASVRPRFLRCEEVVRRRVRTSRDMLAIESALLALQHIGLEAKLVVKPLADHRHRKICRAANLSLEWIAL
ncbi:MAG: hypothetical protein GY854_34355 [Deltaproteobacteria bacterium]|nr:hypothetical protein [Deltaproteobacteria bacterium]